MGVICSHPQICCYSNLIFKACPSKSYLCPKNCFELYPTVYCHIVAINYPIVKFQNFGKIPELPPFYILCLYLICMRCLFRCFKKIFCHIFMSTTY